MINLRKTLIWKGLLCAALVITLIGGTISASAAQFTDTSNHWASESIEALAEGGLVNGYGGGLFGPDDDITIDQLATIIAKAKGIPTGSQNGYWAYDALDYCINTEKCLPNFGDITDEVYAVSCSRELATYMIANGLGTNNYSNSNYGIVWSDIPDYTSITAYYRNSILLAYQMGLTSGVDDEGTFNPMASITRAELCTILYRADITEAAAGIDDSVATGMTGEEIYEYAKTLDCDWVEWIDSFGGEYKTLTATDPLIGGVVVSINANGLLKITMPERYMAAWIVDDVAVDRYGNSIEGLPLLDGCGEDGVMVMSSGWMYESRMLAKELIELAYPTGSDEAYQALLDVMLQEDIYENPSYTIPSAVRWIDGRAYEVKLNDSANSVVISICTIGDEEYYTDSISGSSSGVKQKYSTANRNNDYTEIMYEFYKG